MGNTLEVQLRDADTLKLASDAIARALPTMVHVSQLADRFVSDPAEVVSVGREVLVRVVDVDLQRSRIGLSMRGLSVKRRMA